MGQTLQILTLMLAPFAPYLAQELWEEQGGEESGFQAAVAGFRSRSGARIEVEIVVQINGKVRARLIVPAGTDRQGLMASRKTTNRIQALVAERRWSK